MAPAVKSRWLEGKVAADLAVYSYNIDDLQVQVTTSGSIQELRNAGKVSSDGAEFSLTVRPVTGLAGQAALAPGLGIGQCASQPNPTNNNVVGLLQNLSGTELLRSPEWSGNAGVVYETALRDSINVEFAGGLTYSDSYVANATSQPRSRSPQFTLADASVRLISADDRWEVLAQCRACRSCPEMAPAWRPLSARDRCSLSDLIQSSAGGARVTPVAPERPDGPAAPAPRGVRRGIGRVHWAN